MVRIHRLPCSDTSGGECRCCLYWLQLGMGGGLIPKGSMPRRTMRGWLRESKWGRVTRLPLGSYFGNTRTCRGDRKCQPRESVSFECFSTLACSWTSSAGIRSLRMCWNVVVRTVKDAGQEKELARHIEICCQLKTTLWNEIQIIRFRVTHLRKQTGV